MEENKNMDNINEEVTNAAEEAAEETAAAVEKTTEAVTEETGASVPAVRESAELVALSSDATADDVMDAIEGSDATLDAKAETLCRWAAARAGVIVVAPLLGTGALMANEFYLVNRIAKVYNKKLSEGAVVGFLGAMGGTLAGSILATLIPLSVVQIPIAVGVTFAVGKVTQAWIKDDMPRDLGPYKEMLQEWMTKAKAQAKEIAEDPLKNIPLGDERKEHLKETGTKVKDTLDAMRDKVNDALETSRDKTQVKVQDLRDKTQEKAQDIRGKAQDAVIDAVGKLESKVGTAKDKLEARRDKNE